MSKRKVLGTDSRNSEATSDKNGKLKCFSCNGTGNKAVVYLFHTNGRSK